ncbi:lipid IV(A) 3-deoxy-D-manno-octulosonic acid transferase [Fontimonas sp. SYSU GA230001]|uniref:lipid IV(A) 3-deoxy-D-manno-octulosonic acid transferase n=1 Tax=Fontimonas sp. SYSU GA230001 TaxID=3142450 RepID=UPI0032B35A9B
MRVVYTVLLYLLTPFVLLRLLWRSRELAGYRQRIGERFGLVPRPPQPIAVWVHAVSVGESLAALPLIRALIERHGPGRVLVTTTTPTGSARVCAALGDRIVHVYAPYDLPDVVARFLGRMRPQRVVVMETELWPNLFRALARRRIPLIIANARLSPRSFRGYGRVRGFTASTLADCTRIAAQSEADAQRFRALGAPAERISALGNIKFDQAVPEAQIAAGQALRGRLGAQRPVWIAASTHEGEEDAALAAHRLLLQSRPDALLILVPRHPQRFDAVARLVEKSGLSCTRRSAMDTAHPSRLAPHVLLGDSMGEMFMYFAAADLAFVGGSLVPVGGHNVLEPAQLGKPVLFGQHMHNFVAARDLLLEAGGGLQIDAAGLAAVLRSLLADTARREAMGSAARAAVAANRGACDRLLALIEAA